MIPSEFMCDGEDSSPPLEWSSPPAGTRSFVLLCDDPDALGGTWHHWGAYDIPTLVLNAPFINGSHESLFFSIGYKK